MKTFRRGMTLFELLVVMTIVGIIYSIGIFTLKKEKVTATTMSISTLKTTLLSLSQSSEIRMFCDTSCTQCRVFSNEGKAITVLHLHSNETIQRYGFDRFGELKLLGNTVARTEEGLEQGCFEMSLRPDGSVTPVILKSNNKFYAYTPIGGDKPYIAGSEEALRNILFNESYYPLRGDDVYGTF
ncbi:MAG: type II secretion system protein [Campylobacterales bacterium]|nr:type II secretion system protein [Campylobacterales bacterium]